MIAVRRIFAVTAFLVVAALLTSPNIWGEPTSKGEKTRPAPKLKAQFSEELDKNRFVEKPLLVYENADERVFALQVQAKLPDETAMPHLSWISRRRARASSSNAVARS